MHVPCLADLTSLDINKTEMYQQAGLRLSMPPGTLTQQTLSILVVTAQLAIWPHSASVAYLTKCIQSDVNPLSAIHTQIAVAVGKDSYILYLHC